VTPPTALPAITGVLPSIPNLFASPQQDPPPAEGASFTRALRPEENWDTALQPDGHYDDIQAEVADLEQLTPSKLAKLYRSLSPGGIFTITARVNTPPKDNSQPEVLRRIQQIQLALTQLGASTHLPQGDKEGAMSMQLRGVKPDPRLLPTLLRESSRPVHTGIRMAGSDGKIRLLSPQQFYAETGIQWLDHLEFESNELLEAVRQAEWEPGRAPTLPASSESLEEKLSSPDFLSRLNPADRELLYGDKIDNGFHADVYIKHVDNTVGKGLFAATLIPRGQMITEYTGIVREGGSIYDTTYSMGYDEHSIDAGPARNYAAYINHSERHPNAKAIIVNRRGIPHQIIVALRNIRDEVRMNYGKSYWTWLGKSPVEV
jgi:hypothetical protein